MSAHKGKEENKLHVDAWRPSNDLSLKSCLECVLSKVVNKAGNVWWLGKGSSMVVIFVTAEAHIAQ